MDCVIFIPQYLAGTTFKATLDYFHTVKPTVIHVSKYEDRSVSTGTGERPVTTSLTFVAFSLFFLITNLHRE